MYTSTADFENKFGDGNSASFIYNLTQAAGNTGNGGLVTGSLTDSDMLPNTPITTSLFKLDTTNDTVKNIYPSDVNVASGGGKSTGGTVPVPDYPTTVTGGGTGPTTPTTPTTPPTTPTTPTITGGVKIHIGANNEQSVTITIDSIKSQDLGLNKLSVLTNVDAKQTMDLSYKAINKVSQIRGNLGAQENRLEHAINYINNAEENLQNAESRIRDLDIAKGMMEYSKFQILVQSGQAMLGQANQSTKSVLELLS